MLLSDVSVPTGSYKSLVINSWNICVGICIEVGSLPVDDVDIFNTCNIVV